MITIYTLKGCSFCTRLKEGLNKEGLEYTEKDIDIPENEAEYDKFAEMADTDSVPIMTVGKQLFVPDVSFKSIEEAVALAKKFSQP